MSRYVVKLHRRIKTIEVVTVKKWALAGCCPTSQVLTAPESGWWVVQLKRLIPASQWCCYMKMCFHYSKSGGAQPDILMYLVKRPFYFKKANFSHSGMPRNEAFSVWSWHSLVTRRCLYLQQLSLLVTVRPGFQVVLGGCWDTQLQVAATSLAPGFQSAVLALQSSVLHSGNLLQWGHGLCWTQMGLLPSWHPTVLQGMDKPGKILKAALGELCSPWELTQLLLWINTKTVCAGFAAVRTWTVFESDIRN